METQPPLDEITAARALCRLVESPAQMFELIFDGDDKPFEWFIGDPYPEDRTQANTKKWELTLCPLLDAAWREHCEDSNYIQEGWAWESIHEWWAEALCHETAFSSVSYKCNNGYMTLKKTNEQWAFPSYDDDPDDYDLDDLRNLYIVKLNGDRIFSSKAIEDELTYHMLQTRMYWEEGLRNDAAGETSS